MAILEITLPDNLTVWDIDWLSVYCITAAENFGSVRVAVPSDRLVPPYLSPIQVKYTVQKTLVCTKWRLVHLYMYMYASFLRINSSSCNAFETLMQSTFCRYL